MTRKQAPFVDIFLTNEMVSCTIFQHPDPINQQPFAMAYAMDNKWLYGREAVTYAKQYPQRAVLSLSRLFSDEKEIQIADNTFSSTALIVYYLQQVDRQVTRYLGISARAYTVTVSNSLNLFQRDVIVKAMQMASMKAKRIHQHTDHMALYRQYTNPEAEAYGLCMFMEQSSCGLGLYEWGDGVVESIATQASTAVSDASLIPYLTCNLLQTYMEAGKDGTRLNYPKLLTECERILDTIDVPGIREVYFSEIGTPHTEYTLRIDANEIYGWIKPQIDKVLDDIDQMLTDADRSNPLAEIWIDAESIPYVALQYALAKKFGLPIREANGTARKGAGVFHGILTGEIKDILLLESFPHEISILLKNGNLIPFLVKNMSIPSKKSEVFQAFVTQNHIEIPIFADGRFIGGQLISVGSIPKDEPVEIEIIIDIDAKSEIKVSSKIKEEPHTETSLRLPTAYATEKNFMDKGIFTSALELFKH